MEKSAVCASADVVPIESLEHFGKSELVYIKHRFTKFENIVDIILMQLILYVATG